MTEITVNGVVVSTSGSVIIATPFESDGSEFCSIGSGGAGDFSVNSFDAVGNALVNSDFYFVVFKTTGTTDPPMSAELRNESKESKYGSMEAWRKKDPIGFEAWRQKFVAWQFEQMKPAPYDAPVDRAPLP